MKKVLTHIEISDTRESYEMQLSGGNHFFYIILLLVSIAALVLLPLIKVDLSVSGKGIIRPVGEKTEIKNLRSEIVCKIFIKEGNFIQKGDTLLTLNQGSLNHQVDFLKNEIRKRNRFITDLDVLIQEKKITLSTPLYKNQNEMYSTKLLEFSNKLMNIQKELDRIKPLYIKEIISQKEYEELLFEFKQTQHEKDIIVSNQFNTWNTDLIKMMSEKEDMEKQLLQLEKEKEFYSVISPVSGTIEEFSGIYEGNILHSGQTIAIISPESEKIAEIFVTARDIGLINAEKKVKITVDAFNHTQWGIVEGEILNISNDFILYNNQPVFTVKCSLNKDFLEQKQHIKGYIKKGMTISARFIINRRTLFQILYESTDEWLNPNNNIK